MNTGKLIDSDEEVKEKEIKILVVGDFAVGKTAIIKRFVEDSFSIDYSPTRGVEFYVKKIELSKKKISMKIWDVGGDSLLNKMIETYLHNSKAILFVYDISNQESFTNLKEWVNTINNSLSNKKVKEKPYYALLANKLDQFHVQTSKVPHSETFVKDNSMKSFMVSAKTNDQISYVFTKIACEVLKIPSSEADRLEAQPKIKADALIEEKKVSAFNSTITPEKSLHPPKNTFWNKEGPAKISEVTESNKLMTSNIKFTNPPQAKTVEKVPVEPKKNTKPVEEKKSSACLVF